MFFSTNEYSMGDVLAVYDFELGSDDFIRVSQLFDEAIIAELMDIFDCAEDEAESLLDASTSANEYCDAEKSWKLQGLRAECAQKMGYVACEDEDENGTVYMIKMNDELFSLLELRDCDR